MKRFFLYLMSLGYVVAGINHFVHRSFYEQIMPPYLPWHIPLIYISGVCEIAFGLLLLPVSTRRTAAWLLIALLIAVYPANIQVALDYWYADNPYLWIALARLPLQLLLVWWAWVYTRE